MRRLHVERLQGVRIQGWVWDAETPGDERIELRSADRAVAAIVERTRRVDVNQALGIESPGAGFSIEMSPEVWAAVAATGRGVEVLVNGEKLAHAPIWPRLEAVERWVVAVQANRDGREAELERTAARLHLEAARRWAGAFKPPAQTMPEWSTPPQAEVEGIARLCVFGWSTVPLDASSVEIGNGHVRLGAPMRRVARSDVARHLGLDRLDVGFEVELPGALWQSAGDAAALTLQLFVAGHPIGGPLSMARAGLHAAVDQAMSTGDPLAQRQLALLALEHVRFAGQAAALSPMKRSWLSEMVGHIGVGAPRKDDPAPLEWHPLPKRSAIVGALMLRPTVAGRTLALLAWMKRRAATSGRWERAARAFEIGLTRRVGLFDRRYYMAQRAVEFDASRRPLADYVAEGDDRGLSPMTLFDPKHYARQLAGADGAGVNRLLHYALAGRFQGLSPCEWFDPGHYRNTYADLRGRSIDAAAHFHNWGWRESRRPLPDFDPAAPTRAGVARRLRREQPDATANPLLNYLLRGLPERVSLPEQGRPPWFATARLDGRDFFDPAPWATLPPRAAARAAGVPGDIAETADVAIVDIVVPVYGGAQETLRCLWSVLATRGASPFELVVVDDRGPEPALGRMLGRLAGLGLLTLLVNESNLGFVRSVNRGLALHPERDVVILNADTVVYGDWLFRLLAQARTDPRAASVTPLSNNATVCSYPRTLDENAELSPAEAEALDRAAAVTNAGRHAETPTGVGFCMFMRRAAMKQVGLLDAERFGRGYGEENDWCVRASRAGWRHLIAADIYVTHSGSVSFGGEASPRAAAAVQLLLETYPDYTRRIEAHIVADPLREARARLDAMRLAATAGVHGIVLMVNHARGGGTYRHEREEASRLAGEGRCLLLLRPDAAGSVQLLATEIGSFPNLRRLSAAAGGPFDELLALLPLREVHVHHLADFSADMPETLVRLVGRSGARLVVTLHDYYTICPRINLVDASRHYCGEPPPAGCDRCLQNDAAGREAGAILPWRRRHARLLRAAAEIRIPDEDMLPRIRRHWPDLAINVRPHEPDLTPPMPRPGADGPRHILVIGALSVVKGQEVVRNAAASLAARQAGLRFTLLGYSSDDEGLRAAGVTVLGAYDDDVLAARIDEIDPALIFIPSVWPETYSYVLSAAMMSARRVAVFGFGAQVRRAKAAGVEPLILPTTLFDRPNETARMLATA